MSIKQLMNSRFRDLQGGLFLTVTKADVGEGAGNFMKAGGDIMAWADPFFPDPAIPESVQKALHKAVDDGFAAHYSMPIGDFQLRQTLARHIGKDTGLKLDPSRNILVTPGSDSGLLYAMMPFISPGDEIMVKAVDGYHVEFPYENVYEPDPRQGPIGVCWYNGGDPEVG